MQAGRPGADGKQGPGEQGPGEQGPGEQGPGEPAGAPAAPRSGACAAPTGIDVSAVRGWLSARRGTDAGPLTVSLVTGGLSNLTYRVVEASGRAWALRRPPLGHVLPTAHDMAREFTVLSALAGSPVPVPATLGLCTDESLIGAPFYLMEWVDGRRLATAPDARALTPAEADRACAALVDTLAALHAVDPDAVGLGSFGRPVGFVHRQVLRWHRQWQGNATRQLPALDRLTEGLLTALPEPAPGCVVHGDYRFDNVLLSPSGATVAAVLDWEMSTLGDPLTDLGLMLVYWSEPDDGIRATLGVATGVTVQPGFWSRAQVAERYGALTGRPVHALPFYLALGAYKLAVVLEGIHARHLAKATLGPGGFDRVGADVPTLVELGLRALDGGLPALAS